MYHKNLDCNLSMRMTHNTHMIWTAIYMCTQQGLNTCVRLFGHTHSHTYTHTHSCTHAHKQHISTRIHKSGSHPHARPPARPPLPVHLHRKHFWKWSTCQLWCLLSRSNQPLTMTGTSKHQTRQSIRHGNVTLLPWSICLLRKFVGAIAHVPPSFLQSAC